MGWFNLVLMAVLVGVVVDSCVKKPVDECLLVYPIVAIGGCNAIGWCASKLRNGDIVHSWTPVVGEMMCAIDSP